MYGKVCARDGVGEDRGLVGLEQDALAFRAHGLCASVEIAPPVPLGGREVDSRTTAPLEVAVSLVERLGAPARPGPVDGIEVMVNVRLVGLHRGERVSEPCSRARGTVWCPAGRG